ncbi:MAG: ABC transporter substrate-binding protein [Cyclobacteriaceae bacterium]|nr:ABC transporter substrate-binding protein [Cyclobacteriaceae bacterium]
MKRHLLPLFLLPLLLASCGRFGNKEAGTDHAERIVCIAKQYNEIIYALHAEQDLVAVDLSSTYPPAIKTLPTVGYHRALSAEGILSMKPTLIIHDNNVGPEAVMRQLTDLKIPMKVFDAKGEDLTGTQALISEMGAYFHREKQADSLNHKLEADMNKAIEARPKTLRATKVVIIHYGRASDVYLTLTKNSFGAKLIEWAGGEVPVGGDRGMMQLSAELIGHSDPDVILLTDFGYDRLGSPEQIKTLPGVAGTKAAKNGKIYRVEEHDMVYMGPRTGEIVMKLQQLIHQ